MAISGSTMEGLSLLTQRQIRSTLVLASPRRPWGGDITDFEIVSSTKGFAIVTDANFANSLITFNPSTGQRLTTIPGPLNVFIPQLALNSRNELYVAVRDLTMTTPGVRVFDTVSDRDLIPGPLNVGQLPPIWILFLE